MNRKAVALTLLIVMSTALLMVPSTQTYGQSPFGFQIYQIVPYGGTTSISSGTVDQLITVQAGLDFNNGPYKMVFNGIVVDENNATGYFVSSNFTIPHLPGGNYTIILMDMTLFQNATAFFSINPAYNVKAVIPPAPAVMQEGAPVSLNVTVTGGTANTNYVANITVMAPSPLSTNYTRTVSLTTSAQGTAIIQIPFGDSSFSPSGSSTVYTGTYNAYFNQSQSLATSQFFIGFTDNAQYHRQDKVNMRAVGYRSGQTATVTIQFEDNSTVFNTQATAGSDGVISASWTIPSSAPLGTYAAKISPHDSPKTVPDAQSFTLPGYVMSFRALNLAGQIVPDILVESLDTLSNKVYNSTTDTFGYAYINLELGNQTVSAYWRDVKVGEVRIYVSGNATQDVQCKLTNMRVLVQANQGSQKIAIPFVNLNVSFTYTTRAGATQTGFYTGQTGLDGISYFNSTLPDINYEIVASKFDSTFATVTNKPTAQATSEVIVQCPDETLTLTTVDYNNAVLPNARIELIEQASGIFYSANTGGGGSTSVQVAFGQYRIRVFTADNILLTETLLNVVSNMQSQIKCVIYNLDVSVKVVDYFGNPVSNVNVQYSRLGISPKTATTGGDGTVTFSNVIGGEAQVTAYPSGNENAFVAENLNVESPTAVQLQMANYVSLGGMLVGTTALAAILIIVAVVLVFLGFEMFRRIRSKVGKADKTENSDVQS